MKLERKAITVLFVRYVVLDVLVHSAGAMNGLNIEIARAKSNTRLVNSV